MALAALILATAAASALAMRADDRARARSSTPGSFKIRGDVRGPLVLGAPRPLNLRLINRHPFALRVTRLRVRARMDAAHRRTGCSVREDLRVRQVRMRIAPMLPARSTRTLRQLGVRRLPAVGLRADPARNQDACKGVDVDLAYSGSAMRGAWAVFRP